MLPLLLPPAVCWLLLTDWCLPRSAACCTLLLFCVSSDAEYWLISAVCYCPLLTTAVIDWCLPRSAVCCILLLFCVSPNAECWLMSAVCYYHLLTTADRLMLAEVCYLLHTATLMCVTWCWMVADICCLLSWLPPAVCWWLLSRFSLDPNCCLLVDTSCLLMSRSPPPRPPSPLILPAVSCWQTYSF